ncbi:hypothetical protein SCLCIDRAFT_52751, partial [Scleroderma citrinum Foug A]
NKRVAYTLVSLTTAEAANETINEGLYVNLERLKPCKNKREPICCLKCQYCGQIARDCKRAVDACSTCTKDHCSASCRSFQTYYCVTCQSDLHASADRNCSEYIKRQQALNVKTLENSMPFFPTKESW